MNRKYTVLGYIVSAVIFIVAMIVLYGTAQGDVVWLIMTFAACTVAVIVAVASRGVSARVTLRYLGIAALAFAAIVALDMYSEIIHNNRSNGFLLDGFAAVAYVYVLPICFFAGMILLLVSLGGENKVQ